MTQKKKRKYLQEVCESHFKMVERRAEGKYVLDCKDCPLWGNISVFGCGFISTYKDGGYCVPKKDINRLYKVAKKN